MCVSSRVEVEGEVDLCLSTPVEGIYQVLFTYNQLKPETVFVLFGSDFFFYLLIQSAGEKDV